MLVCGVYMTGLKQFKPSGVHTVLGSIVVGGALTRSNSGTYAFRI